MSHPRTSSHVPSTNESCLWYQWVISHPWITHVSFIDESCHSHARVMSYTWMSHVTRMLAGVVSARSSRCSQRVSILRHRTRLLESAAPGHGQISAGLPSGWPWLRHKVCLAHFSLIIAIWKCFMLHNMKWDMTHSGWPWLRHKVWCLVYISDESCLIYEWLMSHIWMSHVSYMNESCFIMSRLILWLRLLAFHMSDRDFATKYALYRALLGKRPDTLNQCADLPRRWPWLCHKVCLVYGVAFVSRINKIMSVFCNRALKKETVFCKRDL